MDDEIRSHADPTGTGGLVLPQIFPLLSSIHSEHGGIIDEFLKEKILPCLNRRINPNFSHCTLHSPLVSSILDPTSYRYKDTAP